MITCIINKYFFKKLRYVLCFILFTSIYSSCYSQIKKNILDNGTVYIFTKQNIKFTLQNDTSVEIKGNIFYRKYPKNIKVLYQNDPYCIVLNFMHVAGDKPVYYNGCGTDYSNNPAVVFYIDNKKNYFVTDTDGINGEITIYMTLDAFTALSYANSLTMSINSCTFIFSKSEINDIKKILKKVYED